MGRGEPLTPWMGTADTAARAGVTEGTWRGYVARGQAPRPGRLNPETGRPEWLRDTVETWLAARPGRGARTDLTVTATLACGHEKQVSASTELPDVATCPLCDAERDITRLYDADDPVD